MDQISSFIVLQVNSWAVIPESSTVTFHLWEQGFLWDTFFLVLQSKLSEGVDAEPAV